MKKILIPVLASILILGFIGVQDVYGPDEQPEKLSLGGNGYNSDTNQFEVKILVHLPKGSDHRAFSVDTTMELFKPDGTPIRAILSSDPVPAGVKEGGNNSSVHKLTAKIPFTPDADLVGEKVRVKTTASLLDSDGNQVVHRVKWDNITLKRG